MTRAASTRSRLATVRFAIMATAVAGTIAAIMLGASLDAPRVPSSIVLSIPLFVALYVVGASLRLAALGVGLLLASAALGSFSIAERSVGLFVADMGLRAAGTAFVIFWVAREVLLDESVSLDTILGGISVYLMLGYLFAHFFLMLEFSFPGSLAVNGQPFVIALDAPHPLQAVGTLVYYSFTTLTTLAFGDITPTHPVTRLVSICEGMVGQLFPTIFIARLVSLNLSQSPGPRHRD